VAKEAKVSETTARHHLNRLDSIGVLLSKKRNRTTYYYPEPLHDHMKHIRELQQNFKDINEIMSYRDKIINKINDISSRYEAESPSQLRTQYSVESDSIEQFREITKVASEWETLLYRKSVCEDAFRYKCLFEDSEIPMMLR